MRTIVTRLFQVERSHQTHIIQTGANACSGCAQCLRVRSDGGREARVIAVIEQLEQLLVGPRGALLRPQVIQYEHLGLAHEGKQMSICSLRGRSKSGAEIIQQIWDGCEKHDGSSLQTGIRKSCCQVRFAAAIGTNQQEPARWGCSKLDYHLESFLQTRHLRVKGLKAFLREDSQMRKRLELLATFAFEFLLFTLAGDQFPEGGVPKGH